MTEAPHYLQVLESVRKHGPILPVYTYLGRVMDGELRHRAALECGKRPRFEKLPNEGAAAALLWRLHPQRAFEWFGAGRPLVDLAALFCAPPREVLAVLKANAPAPDPKYRRRDYSGRQNVRLPVDCKRTVLAWAKSWRAQQQEVIIAAIRAADEERVKREVMQRRKTERRTRKKSG